MNDETAMSNFSSLSSSPSRSAVAPAWLADATTFQRRLARFNAQRIAPAQPHDDWAAEVQREAQMRLEEGAFLENLRAGVVARAAAAPTEADAFVAWFEQLEQNGPGQHDPLFEWLARSATREQMLWFLRQEVAGEAGFDDLLAYTQVKLPTLPKLEMARNFWDEMGRGSRKGMHGPMLSDLATEVQLNADIDATVWEALALANAMLGLALNRRYAYHAIGALGIVEQTAPGRVQQVGSGLKRLGFSARQRIYFDLHSAMDIRHSASWNAQVIHPLVAANSALAPSIAEGALIRLSCGARCFERYRAELWRRPHIAPHERE
ncbi:MAG: iron-containing redox enzyme family protein [Nevskia sp.]|nr:iron-containing redox enzyme family protein [Nevskia sp.]